MKSVIETQVETTTYKMGGVVQFVKPYASERNTHLCIVNTIGWDQESPYNQFIKP